MFIASKTVRMYSQHYSEAEKANLASRWFKQREEIIFIPNDEVMWVLHSVKR